MSSWTWAAVLMWYSGMITRSYFHSNAASGLYGYGGAVNFAVNARPGEQLAPSGPKGVGTVSSCHFFKNELESSPLAMVEVRKDGVAMKRDFHGGAF